MATKIKKIIKEIKSNDVTTEYAISFVEDFIKQDDHSISSKKRISKMKKIPPYLWDNLNFCKKMIRYTSDSIRFVNQEFFENANFRRMKDFKTKEAFENIRKFCSEDVIKYFCNDDDYMYSIIEQDGTNIKFASDSLKKNKNLIIDILYRYNEDNYKEILESFLDDQNFLIDLLIRFKLDNEKEFLKLCNPSVEIISNKWGLMTNDLKKFFFEKYPIKEWSEDIVLDYATQTSYISVNIFKNNEDLEFSDSFIRKYAHRFYQYLPEKYKENRELIEYLLENTHNKWQFLPKKYQKEKDLCLLALSRDNIWDDLSDSQKNDFDIFLEYIYHYKISQQDVKNFNPEFFKNETVAKIVLPYDANIYKDLDINIRNNPKIIEFLISLHEKNYWLLDDQIKYDVKIALDLLEKGLITNPEEVLAGAVFYNKDVVLKVVDMYPSTLNSYLDKKFLSSTGVYEIKEIVQKIKNNVEKAYADGEINKKLFDNYLKKWNEYREQDLYEEINKIEKKDIIKTKVKI